MTATPGARRKLRARGTAVWLIALFAMWALPASSAATFPTVSDFLGNGTTLGSCVFPAPIGGEPANCVTTGDPPDTNGAVGPNDYVQIVNGGYAVWNKSGTMIQSPRFTNLVFAGMSTADGNECPTENDGDPIIRYDQLANRWLIAQFDIHNYINSNTGPSYECVAVSKTGDPTGAYSAYDFKYNAAINDYPKFGVWPDGYYVTYNEFSATAFLDSRVCALDRTAMLAGAARATQQCFTSNTDFSLLPANVDGPLAPPAGTPEPIAALVSSTRVDIFKLKIDWTNPGNSSLGTATQVTVPSYSDACGPTGTCIKQPSPGNSLDSLGDRLMDRLVYRNFGTHDSLIVTHSVASGSSTGIRWYEFRRLGLNQTPSLFQQGTYAPDSSFRWMGSIAEDQAGDMGIGYSLSSSTIKPSVAITGRLGSDTTGTMTQGEDSVISGGGVETGKFSDGTTATRWGDYSNMSVDPSDDCTFWYTTEYYPSNGIFNWDTRVASFKFPNCAANDFTIGANPTSVTVAPGGSNTTQIQTALASGSAETVTPTAMDLPTGATASFVPSTITAGGSTTLTLTAGPSTPAGAYRVRVSGTAASALHYTTVTFNVQSRLTVTKSVSGSGRVTSNPSGIDCGSTCSALFDPGTPVTLTATPDTGSTFLGWTYPGCSSSTACDVTMDADHSVVASFDALPTCSNLSGLTTPADTQLAVALSCSDPDSGDTVGYSIVSPPAHGSLGVPDAAGHVTYTPQSGYVGSDSFTYRATDSHGQNSAIATVNLSVGQISAPSCANEAVSVAHNTTKTIALACSHPNLADTLSYSIVSSPSHGTLGVVGSTGAVTYTPNHGYGGSDSFTYRATDNHARVSNTATITITVAADRAPICSGQTASVPHAKPKQLSLGCSDPDPGDAIHWAIVVSPAHGRLSGIDATGHVTYTPNKTFAGTDRFSFKAIDGDGTGSAPATVFLHVATAPKCSGLKGKKLRRCKATLKRAKALKACSHIRDAKKRQRCINAANHAYKVAVGIRHRLGIRASIAGTPPPPPRLVLPFYIRPGHHFGTG